MKIHLQNLLFPQFQSSILQLHCDLQSELARIIAPSVAIMDFILEPSGFMKQKAVRCFVNNRIHIQSLVWRGLILACRWKYALLMGNPNANIFLISLIYYAKLFEFVVYEDKTLLAYNRRSLYWEDVWIFNSLTPYQNGRHFRRQLICIIRYELAVLIHMSLRHILRGPVNNTSLSNSLRPSDTIWRHRSGSTLAQVMACCLTAPSHYLNQCWLIISKV